jgi:hypothetical protein
MGASEKMIIFKQESKKILWARAEAYLYQTRVVIRREAKLSLLLRIHLVIRSRLATTSHETSKCPAGPLKARTKSRHRKVAAAKMGDGTPRRHLLRRKGTWLQMVPGHTHRSRLWL